MRVIHKYPFEADATKIQKLKLPHGGRIVFVGLDCDRVPALWIEFEKDASVLRPEDIFVIGTGMDIPGYARHHLGTFLQGIFVWHIYSRYSLK